MKTALITGVTGQDGILLSKYLLSVGYAVVGSSRYWDDVKISKIKKYGLYDNLKRITLSSPASDEISMHIEENQITHIFHLAAESNARLAFNNPGAHINGSTSDSLSILESLRLGKYSTKCFFAGSTYIYQGSLDLIIDESTVPVPKDPYAVSKLSNLYIAKVYRESYNIDCVVGILTNHESPLRPKSFVSMKILDAALKIKTGSADKLILGNVDVYRDWGWGEEFVEAYESLLNAKNLEDCIIATGESMSLRYFAEAIFSEFGLNIDDYLEINEALVRPQEIKRIKFNPSKIKELTGWRAKVRGVDVAKRLVSSVLE